MRILALAIIGPLTVAVSVPAFAAQKKKATPAPPVASWEACESRAIAQGLTHDKSAIRKLCENVWGKDLADAILASSEKFE